jgi:hypothetical protein
VWHDAFHVTVSCAVGSPASVAVPIVGSSMSGSSEIDERRGLWPTVSFPSEFCVHVLKEKNLRVAHAMIAAYMSALRTVHFASCRKHSLALLTDETHLMPSSTIDARIFEFGCV